MKNKRTIICLSVVVVIAAGVTFKYQRSQGRAKETAQQADAIPDYEVYRHLFHHHVTMKQKAEPIASLNESVHADQITVNGNSTNFSAGTYIYP